MLAFERRQDPREQEADDVAVDVALGGRRPTGPELQAAAAGALPTAPRPGGSEQAVRAMVGARTDADLSGVRVVPDSLQAQAARSIAFAEADEVHMAPGAYRPDHPFGRALLAHELVHTTQLAGGSRRSGLRLHFCQDCGTSGPTTSTSSGPTGSGSAAPSPAPAPTVTGASVRGAADPMIADFNLFTQVQDGLAQLQRGQNIRAFLRATGRQRVDQLCDRIGASPSDKAARLASYDALVADTANPSSPAWTADRDALLVQLRPQVVQRMGLAGMNAGQQNQNLNWLQNVPAQVLQVILECSTPDVPPALLYAAAVNEGLVDGYIRAQVPGAGPQLTNAQLAAISVSEGVSGYQALGLDVYHSELAETRRPLTGYLPPGFDRSRVTVEENTNERGQRVRSAHVPDLRTGLQVQAATLARRLALFEDARVANGYAAPTGDQRAFFGYVFYNPGQNNGRRSLEAHRPGGPDPRTLDVWITRGEYANAQKVLRTYRMMASAGLLRGF